MTGVTISSCLHLSALSELLFSQRQTTSHQNKKRPQDTKFNVDPLKEKSSTYFVFIDFKCCSVSMRWSVHILSLSCFEFYDAQTCGVDKELELPMFPFCVWQPIAFEITSIVSRIGLAIGGKFVEKLCQRSLNRIFLQNKLTPVEKNLTWLFNQRNTDLVHEHRLWNDELFLEWAYRFTCASH